jgi:glycosyltransferase involved in cell wall biosynthesis
VFYDAIPIRHPEFFTPVTLSSYLRSLSLARDVDAISCISHTVRDDLMNLLAVLPRQRPPLLAVHALGADLPDEASLQPVTFDRPVVLCVGTVEPRKNQLRILQAMMSAQRSGSRFVGVFAGNAGWLNGDFRTALAAATAAGHDIVLRENVSNAELRGLYAAAAFTIYGSLDEGFGLPIIESLRHGCPCITSDRGSMREIAEQTGGCLLVDPENPADIAAAIVGLVDDPDALARLAREAEEADWPTWQQYTAQLVRFATRPAPGLEIPQRRTA